MQTAGRRRSGPPGWRHLNVRSGEMNPKAEGSVTLLTKERDAAFKPDGRAGSRLFPAGHLVPFILVTVLFFLWGIPNNLNDLLIRHFMKSFAITRFQAGLVQPAFYLGYFLLAMPPPFIFLPPASSPPARPTPVLFRPPA